MRDCENCIHAVTPKGNQCYTLTRELKERLGNKPCIPEYVMPILGDIARYCERYESKDNRWWRQ